MFVVKKCKGNCGAKGREREEENPIQNWVKNLANK
jgi:hypothetical protein